jgi:hypothetical protein
MRERPTDMAPVTTSCGISCAADLVAIVLGILEAT